MTTLGRVSNEGSGGRERVWDNFVRFSKIVSNFQHKDQRTRETETFLDIFCGFTWKKIWLIFLELKKKRLYAHPSPLIEASLEVLEFVALVGERKIFPRENYSSRVDHDSKTYFKRFLLRIRGIYLTAMSRQPIWESSTSQAPYKYFHFKLISRHLSPPTREYWYHTIC